MSDAVEPRRRQSIAQKIEDVTGLSFEPQRNPQALYDKEGNMILGFDEVIRLHSFIDKVRKWVNDPTEDQRRQETAEWLEAIDRRP